LARRQIRYGAIVRMQAIFFIPESLSTIAFQATAEGGGLTGRRETPVTYDGLWGRP
jgi:hypothetical protein